ncbi:MAG: hypothetical protein Q9202_004774 [Teloschistes flavicans]
MPESEYKQALQVFRDRYAIQPLEISDLSGFLGLLDPAAFKHFAKSTGPGEYIESTLASNIIKPILAIIQLRRTHDDSVNIGNGEFVPVGADIPPAKFENIKYQMDNYQDELYQRVHRIQALELKSQGARHVDATGIPSLRYTPSTSAS